MTGLLARLFGRRSASAPDDDPRRRDVEAALDELRPLLRADGGDVELVGISEDAVTLRFRGACTHCAASVLTLKGALEPRLRERLPWLRVVRMRS